MERVIITGATGFIGRNFIKYLINKNVEIYAVSYNCDYSFFKVIKNIHFIKCDLKDIKYLPEKISLRGFDVFYHFAWMGTTGEQRADYELQTKNALYTCDAAVSSKKLQCRKFITTGTITEHIAEGILVQQYTSENLMYGLSKYYTHSLLDILCHQEEISYVWAQLSNIYGGDNTNGNLISYTIKEFNQGRIPSYGPCEQPYNFTYIKDVLKALYILGKDDTQDKQYFISNGECRLLKDYLNELAKFYNKSVNIGERPDDGLRYVSEWFNNQSLLNIGFQPEYSFEKGIKEMRGRD